MCERQYQPSFDHIDKLAFQQKANFSYKPTQYNMQYTNKMNMQINNDYLMMTTQDPVHETSTYQLE